MCLCPLTLKVEPKYFNAKLKGGKRYVQVPCGHCFECLKRKQNDWYVRLFSEFNGKHCCFFTLTYNEDKVPTIVDLDTGECFHSVCKEHIQKAFKRFRINFERSTGKKIDCKYFIASEYGPKTLRPHYHGIVNCSRVEFNQFLIDWQNKYGYTDCKDIKDLYGALRYVTKYALKGGFDSPLVKRGLVNKSFRLISKGIGKEWIKSHISKFLPPVFHFDKVDWFNKRKDYLDKIIDRLKININGFVYGLPKYFKEIIFQKSPFLSAEISARILERNDLLHIRQLAELQTQFPIGQAVKIYAQTIIQTFNDKQVQASRQAEKYVRFLAQSYL